MAERNETRWLLLIHQIPPKPDYFRVKIWRRLQKIGAVAIKNSVYVLPRSEQALEDFQWILREVSKGGGDASICEAGFVEGLSDEQVVAMFRAARDADYATLAEEAREVLRHFPASPTISDERRGELESGLARLGRRLEEVIAIDFFHANGRETAEALIGEIEARLRPPQSVERCGMCLPFRRCRSICLATHEQDRQGLFRGHKKSGPPRRTGGPLRTMRGAPRYPMNITCCDSTSLFTQPLFT